MRPRTIFYISIALIVTIAMLNAAAMHWRLYWTYWWFDIPMHFLGGLWTGLFILWSVYLSGFPLNFVQRAMSMLTVALLGVVGVGVIWELFELISRATLVSQDAYVTDTVLDLIMDTLGGLAAWGIVKAVKQETVFPEEHIYHG